MKKLLLKFADQVLSREELRNVKGGDGPYGGANCGLCSLGGQNYACNTAMTSSGPSCFCSNPYGSPCH